MSGLQEDDLLALLDELALDSEGADGELLEALALAAGPLVEPPAHLRRDLLAHLDGTARYAGFAQRVSALFHLDETTTASLLDTLDRPERWKPLFPGVSRLATMPGASLLALAGKVSATFLRVAPGAEFPYHRHLGAESLLVLDGGLVSEGGSTDGQASHPGDLLENGEHSGHAVRASDEGCLAAVLLFGGIELAPRPDPAA
jgi:quercetin dioxygenase-like cupin family protein